jgi:hypothetical protein
MPRTPIPDELTAFLAQPNPSVIATITPEGQPHTARVTEIADDEDLAGIDRLARHYYARREDPRVNAWIEVDSWGGAPWTGS